MSIVKKISELENTIKRQSEQIDKLEKEVAFLKEENNSLVKENQSLKKERENAIFVDPERKRHIEETERLKNLERIIKVGNENSIQAVRELLEIWDKSTV